MATFLQMLGNLNCGSNAQLKDLMDKLELNRLYRDDETVSINQTKEQLLQAVQTIRGLTGEGQHRGDILSFMSIGYFKPMSKIHTDVSA